MTQANQAPLPMPQVNGAEQAVLGTLLLGGMDPDVAVMLRSSDFYKPQHAYIYDAVTALSDENRPISEITVGTFLQIAGQLSQVGGAAYLQQLTQFADPGSVLYHAEQVRDAAARRKLIQIHQRGIQNAMDGSGFTTLNSLFDDAQTSLDSIIETRGTADVIAVEEALIPTLDTIESLGKTAGAITGVPTGFADLDEMLTGLHAGQLVVVAGRPGAGKSTLAFDVIRSASLRYGLPTLMFTMEMSRVEMMMRLLSAECRIPLTNLKSGSLNDGEWDRIHSKMNDIASAPIFIDDTAETTITSIRTNARRIKNRHGLSLVVVDYLQLISSDGRFSSRQEEVASWSRRLKLLAKELAVPIILVAQLNRGPESRSDKRPQVSDLRESGAIEQDADVVALVHREDMYDPNSTRIGEADIIVGKHRSGPTGTITVSFQGHYCRMVDLAHGTPPPPPT